MKVPPYDEKKVKREHRRWNGMASIKQETEGFRWSIVFGNATNPRPGENMVITSHFYKSQGWAYRGLHEFVKEKELHIAFFA